jgi:hypothetical protein
MKQELKKQLMTPLRDFQIFNYYSRGQAETESGDTIPFIFWPDGTPCTVANLFIVSLLDRAGRGGQGLSRTGSKCGTLGDFAFKISHLIKFCYRNRTRFIDLTDSTFSDFMHQLRIEDMPEHPLRKARSGQSVFATGQACLNFLIFVGKLMGDDNFVSEQGTIRVTFKPINNIDFFENSIQSKQLYHRSFGLGSTPMPRNPITEENTNRLRQAIHIFPSSSHIKQRRQLLISFLEFTGARIGEIRNIRIFHIRDAIQMKHPMLTLLTLKKGRDIYRKIPVTRLLLTDAMKYIDIYRRPIVRKHFKGPLDHDFLFVSDITGSPLKTEYLSNEIGTLRRKAEIEEQACAHMFRHAFITNLYVELIHRHHFENDSAFLRELMTSSMLIGEIREWTGQNPDSLIRYIHLAFSKLSGLSSAVKSVYRANVQEIFDLKLEELLVQLEQGMSIAEYRIQYEQLKKLRDEDFAIASSREDLNTKSGRKSESL